MLYVVYCSHIEDFKVMELDIKLETDRIITFDYRSELKSGQIFVENLDKVIQLKNDEGTMVVTKDRKKVGNYVDLLARREKIYMKDLTEKMTGYKRKIRLVVGRYV